MIIDKTSEFYLQKDEPHKSCLLALQTIILSYSNDISETRKYGMPCFCYRSKPLCYLWTDKKNGEPYILVVEGRNIDHPMLEQGTRSRMKILRINPEDDIPVDVIRSIFDMALELDFYT